MISDWLPKGSSISGMQVTLANNDYEVLRISLDDDGGGFYIRLEAEQPFAINSDELVKLANHFNLVAQDLDRINKQ